jgi:hypothetical protein
MWASNSATKDTTATAGVDSTVDTEEIKEGERAEIIRELNSCRSVAWDYWGVVLHGNRVRLRLR